MNKSESIKNLSSALSTAQAEMPPVKFNATNPFLKNKYADLGAIIETAQPVLAKHGLSVSQLVYSENAQVGVETVLMHSSGEWISNKLDLPAGDEKGKSNAQVAGSIITYIRRYALAAVLGMYADEDGDGNKARKQDDAAGDGPEQPAFKLQAQQVNPLPEPKGMALESAVKVQNSKGENYGDLPTEKLLLMHNEIIKKLKDNSISRDRRDQYLYKRDAIVSILNSRKEASL